MTDINELKAILKKKKMTYGQLAEKTGYSKSCITKIFGGFAKYPRQTTIKAIEEALDVSDNSPLENGKLQTLSENEKQLLSSFSSLNEDFQNCIIEFTKNIADIYKKK